eukprot:CAMPEP_0170643246 /NCGR_PEP_ID=MMETSP0224-20130122/41778_1 /TAXON_ID=285029 /ORGANISM="Togula jolla, Strain CCCM 725" /LENGTH=88 /DNA_ID=CAMNT_0010974051 /DNA_START=233 /DNA_END=499 /DNA_ORIENTATION=+
MPSDSRCLQVLICGHLINLSLPWKGPGVQDARQQPPWEIIHGTPLLEGTLRRLKRRHLVSGLVVHQSEELLSPALQMPQPLATIEDRN